MTGLVALLGMPGLAPSGTRRGVRNAIRSRAGYSAPAVCGCRSSPSAWRSTDCPAQIASDLRQTLMRPRGVVLAGELVLERLTAGAAVDAVGGMAVGAVPLISAVLAAAAREEKTPLLGFFVRKERKAHGLGRLIEGGYAPGQSVAILEDTDGDGRAGAVVDDAQPPARAPDRN